MPDIIEISDFSAPELDIFARLTEAQLRSRQHAERALLIAEGEKVIGHALDAGLEPVSFLMERRHISGKAHALLERCEGVPVYTADSALLSGLTGYTLTRGVLCAMKRPAQPEADALCRSARRIALLEDIVDPTNVGAIFRSAAALGVDAVLLTPGCCDPLSRRAIRVSMGTVFQIPWARICARPADWPEASLARLRGMGFKSAAMALDDRAIPLNAPEPAAEPRLAIVLGTEGDGLSPATLQSCDYTICIPMSHGVDSLNVAAASAVAFWQLCAQRPETKTGG